MFTWFITPSKLAGKVMWVPAADLLPRALPEVPHGVDLLALSHVGDELPVVPAQPLRDSLEAVLGIVAAQAEIVGDVIAKAGTAC